MELIRLSVRALVEFTLHGEDLYPSGGSLRDMQEGLFGHKGRQRQLGEGWQAEVPLTLDVPVEEDGFCLRLGGRMDAFQDGGVPVIEEIKLSQGKEPPEAPYAAHRMQAVCYGHMLCAERGIGRVAIRVTYVDKKGRVRAQFDEELSAEDCREAFQSVLWPYVRRTRQVRPCGRCVSLSQVTARASGTWRCRCTPRSSWGGGCMPRCPRARASRRRRCSRRSRRWARG